MYLENYLPVVRQAIPGHVIKGWLWSVGKQQLVHAAKGPENT